MTDPLAGHRARIDAIDERILELLEQRNDLAAEVIATKIEAGLPVIVAEDPLTCVARGGGRALEMIDEGGTDVFSVE